MLSKKYIFVLAFAGLFASCQKEVVQPHSDFCTSGEENLPIWRSASASSNTSTDNGANDNAIRVESNEVNKGTDADITDPNHDDDRNKKKKN